MTDAAFDENLHDELLALELEYLRRFDRQPPVLDAADAEARVLWLRIALDSGDPEFGLHDDAPTEPCP